MVDCSLSKQRNVNQLFVYEYELVYVTFIILFYFFSPDLYLRRFFTLLESKDRRDINRTLCIDH